MQTKKKNLYQSILFTFCLATFIYNTTCYAVIEKYLLYTTNNTGVLNSNDNKSNTLQPQEEIPHSNSPASDLNSTSSSSTQESSPPPVSPLFLSPNQSQIESTSFIISPTTSPNIPYPNENNPASRETPHPNSPANCLNSTPFSSAQKLSLYSDYVSPLLLSARQPPREPKFFIILPSKPLNITYDDENNPTAVVIHIS